MEISVPTELGVGFENAHPVVDISAINSIIKTKCIELPIHRIHVCFVGRWMLTAIWGIYIYILMVNVDPQK